MMVVNFDHWRLASFPIKLRIATSLLFHLFLFQNCLETGDDYVTLLLSIVSLIEDQVVNLFPSMRVPVLARSHSLRMSMMLFLLLLLILKLHASLERERHVPMVMMVHALIIIVLKMHVLLRVYRLVVGKDVEIQLLQYFLAWKWVKVPQERARRLLFYYITMLIVIDILQVIWFQNWLEVQLWRLGTKRLRTNFFQVILFTL